MDFQKLTFTFIIDNLWDIARLQSANTANHIPKQDGESSENKLALTNSERDLWNVSLRYPANAVYNYLMSAGKIKDNDYQFNVVNSDGKLTIIYILYLHPEWDANLTRDLNDNIEKAIVAGTLAAWFKSSMHPAWELYQQEHTEALQAAKLNIMKRKFKTWRNTPTF